MSHLGSKFAVFSMTLSVENKVSKFGCYLGVSCVRAVGCAPLLQYNLKQNYRLQHIIECLRAVVT